MASWASVDGALAAFGVEQMAAGPCYLATVAANGLPRVHPVTPFVAEGRLWVFMEPTSPKGRDLRERGGFALHTTVPDNAGTGGEFLVRGTGRLEADAAVRLLAAAACPYPPADRYVLFELEPVEVRSLVYAVGSGSGSGSGYPVKQVWRA